MSTVPPTRPDTEPDTVEHAVAQYQAALNDLLDAFLNGRLLARRARVMFPCSRRLDRSALQEHVDRVVAAWRRVVERQGHDRSRLDEVRVDLPAQRTVHVRTACEFLARACRGLSHLVETVGDAVHRDEPQWLTCATSEAFESSLSAQPFLRQVPRLRRFYQRRLSPYTVAGLVHGSLADGGYVDDYSDLDTLVVLSRSTVLDAERLAACWHAWTRSLAFLFAHDPLAHHGHMVLTEIDLALYPEHRLPIEMLDAACPLDRQGVRIEIRPTACALWRRHRFMQTCRTVRAQLGRFAHVPSAYDLKHMLSVLMLLPALCLQARGQRSTKRESFDRIKGLIDEADANTLDRFSESRRRWRHRGGAIRLVESAVARSPNPFTVVRVDRWLNRGAPRDVIECLGPDWTTQAMRYVDTLQSLAENV